MVATLLNSTGAAAGEIISLPLPSLKGNVSVEEALQSRRTIRQFAHRPLSLQQVAQLLWATYGVTESRRGLRATPSAGALYPLDVYLVAGERQVGDLAGGVYHYLPDKHGLNLVKTGELRPAVARVSLHQGWMAEAPIMVVITGEYARCTRKYGQRGIMYTHMESGHAAQNLFLQAEAQGLGVGIVGAFENRLVIQVLDLPANHDPLLIMPVGYK
jgi:SagB-type dehydrogenase family enzyme